MQFQPLSRAEQEGEGTYAVPSDKMTINRVGILTERSLGVQISNGLHAQNGVHAEHENQLLPS